MPPVLEEIKSYKQISSGGTWENRDVEILSFLSLLCVSFTAGFLFRLNLLLINGKGK